MIKLPNLVPALEFQKQLKEKLQIGINKSYAIIKEPGFPSVRIGGRLYVLADKVEEWLTNKIMEKDK